ncbi:hypothetical protein [Runella sp.]|uniref:hypothetical protein n=1 Tax=Runella sp. TaxID=1960881 RepID=UPI003D1275BF
MKNRSANFLLGLTATGLFTHSRSGFAQWTANSVPGLSFFNDYFPLTCTGGGSSL